MDEILTEVFCPLDQETIVVETNCHVCDLYGGEGTEEGRKYITCNRKQQEINDLPKES